MVLWASLVQLQKAPAHSLAEARDALQHAVALDDDSPAAAIELVHFLDAVEDDPRAAASVFCGAVVLARRLLLEGLLGQARALVQFDEESEAFRCLAEALRLADQKSLSRQGKTAAVKAGCGPNGLAAEIDNLLKEFVAPAHGRKK